jgi:hypothetical protein
MYLGSRGCKRVAVKEKKGEGERHRGDVLMEVEGGGRDGRGICEVVREARE